MNNEMRRNLATFSLSTTAAEPMKVASAISRRSKRKQLRFEEYLTKRATDSAYTFRQHLRKIGGAIEE